MELTKQQKMYLIAEKIKTCQKCKDLIGSTINKAPGNGNPNSKIVRLGEACGKDETKSGNVFVGRAGQLLTNILNAAGLDREKDVFILNILKCRPPDNRKPTEEEAINCSNFLRIQLKVIQPKIILCLGATAAQNILKVDTPISSLREQWYDYKIYDNSPIIKIRATFHPSYALRNNFAKNEIYNDLKIVLSEI
jgi:uracil-DNA glycosylase family 4